LVARVFVVYEIIPASSARFPWLNNRSRDRSPPRTRGLEAEGELYVTSNSGKNADIPSIRVRVEKVRRYQWDRESVRGSTEISKGIARKYGDIKGIEKE
jgi:hypothetical protein